MPKLTPKQETFCQEYLVDLNATQAAIRAGYSEKVAAQQGAENLRKPYIATRVDELLNKRAERTQLSIDWVLSELQENVQLAREKKDYASANRALELLGKHLGLFKEQVTINNRPDPLQEARERIKDMSPLELSELYRRSVRGEKN